MLSLLPEINVNKTVFNAKQVLSCYRALQRMAGAEFTQSLTASYSSEPKGPVNNSSTIENIVINRINGNKASEEVAKICFAVNRLNKLSQEIIKYSYLTQNEYTELEVQEIVRKYGGNFRELKKKALLMFAEAYEHGELLEF
ncbi:ArpU family phage packaging/lysis transcriptional regulator [Listeria fleischmannii]|uniref:Phage transcriptional regulator, ArpU family protein n=1 Tax=Listeria fleischmannii FSL S10-1203 TaxID=1265822 RepID=W7DAZ5_9LIST|nr:ArpU family phage packaging/lysis transcriptional regulator [Listeria fleischmannii]EUJ42453.1 phage transcriptional regulator, ArpU family protein [Listeria fleischmannii FSL S10-1203]